MRGEQYVGASPRLWDEKRFPGLANAVRRWMTLYDDQVADIAYKLGNDIEGWSYFGYGNVFRFVARLGSGGEFGPRLAYFTHARAWDYNDFQNGDDPGAFLGCSAAFVQMWREGQEIPEVEESLPPVPWKDVVKDRAWPAIRLLAQLYRACVTGPPVVMGVPYREFVKGGRLHQLVAFARAALPLEMKRDCRIRIFTGRPDIYLRELETHLVVIPEEFASDALTARPDVALLDLECETKAGPAADTAYAQAVVDRFLKLPQFLLAYTGRIKLPPRQLPGPADAQGAAVNYNLLTALGDVARMDSLLEHFWQEAGQRQIVLDWNQLIHPAEWSQFSEAKLIDVSFRVAASADQGALRQRVRLEVTSRGIVLDDASQGWIQTLPADVRAREILELVDAKLVSTATASALMRYVTGPEIDLLLADPKTAGLVAHLLAHVDVPKEWLDELTRGPKHLTTMMGFAQQNAGWRRVVDKIIETLIHAPEMLAGIKGQLPELPPPDPNTDLENYLNWMEFLARLGSPAASVRRERLAQALTAREGRRRLFHLLNHPQWNTALQSFVVPAAWDNDIGDLLLQSNQQLAKIGIERILRFPQLQGGIPDDVQLLLDPEMQARGEATTKALIENRLWLVWRQRTALNPSELRTCAIEWLLGAPADAWLEEWKQVMKDLANDPENRGIIAADLRRNGQAVSWPRIKLFENEQAKDLAGLCVDLGTLAELAETANLASSDYALFLDNSRFRGAIQASDLRYLNLQTKDLPPLDLARYLVTYAGHRKEHAYKAMGRSVLYNLIGQPELALDTARQTDLWRDPEFQQQFVSWLVRINLDPRQAPQKQLLDLLDREVANVQRFNVQRPGGAQALASDYDKCGFRNLAAMLSSALGDDPVYTKLMNALLAGDTRANIWKIMNDKLKEFNSASPDDHPLMILAAKISELPAPELGQIDQRGWPTFNTICRMYPGYTLSCLQNPPLLPVLCLAVTLRDGDSLGVIATGILSLFSGATSMHLEKKWWAAFFETIRTCRRRSGFREARDRLEAAGAVVSRAMRDLQITYPAGLQELDKFMDGFIAMESQAIPSQTLVGRMSQ